MSTIKKLLHKKLKDEVRGDKEIEINGHITFALKYIFCVHKKCEFCESDDLTCSCALTIVSFSFLFFMLLAGLEMLL